MAGSGDTGHVVGPHTPLKIFTLKSPWLASAMLHGEKLIENRSTVYAPGWYAVHVGVGREDPWCEDHVRTNVGIASSLERIESDIKDGLIPRGHVIGLVYIAYTLPLPEADKSIARGWALGPFCNVITQRLFLHNPVPARGQLGACHVRSELLAEIVAQLGNAVGQCGHIGVSACERTLDDFKLTRLLAKREERRLKKSNGDASCKKRKCHKNDKDGLDGKDGAKVQWAKTVSI